MFHQSELEASFKSFKASLVDEQYTGRGNNQHMLKLWKLIYLFNLFCPSLDRIQLAKNYFAKLKRQKKEEESRLLISNVHFIVLRDVHDVCVQYETNGLQKLNSNTTFQELMSNTAGVTWRSHSHGVTWHGRNQERKSEMQFQYCVIKALTSAEGGTETRTRGEVLAGVGVKPPAHDAVASTERGELRCQTACTHCCVLRYYSPVYPCSAGTRLWKCKTHAALLIP